MHQYADGEIGLEPWLKDCTAVAYFAYGVCGLAVYITVLVAINKQRDMLHPTFYKFAKALGAVDVCHLLFYTLLAAPSSYVGHTVWLANVDLSYLIGATQACIFLANLLMTLLISLNRFFVCTSMVFPKLTSSRFAAVFTAPHLAKWPVVGVLVLSALLAAYHSIIVQCPQTFVAKNVSSAFACDMDNPTVLLSTYMSALLLMPVLMFILYIVTFYSMHKMRTQGNVQNVEFRILIQAFMIALTSITTMLTFFFTRGLFGVYYATVTNLINMTNISVNPIIYIIFSKEIKQLVFRTKTQSTAPVQVYQVGNKVADGPQRRAWD